ncbi:restriction endonuclease subunit S [Bacillus altitudinis]|uniref:Restriction endonuclease subunit S n=1 Tax=Bacillus altitudinis TaxID=293387 RepID=A0ABV1S7I1_BACAB|nr:restriction endonuclease subunit S [Bacillus pumilus]
MSKKKKTIEELLKEALVSDEQQPYEVPENWVWTKLGCVFEQVKEQIQPTGNEKYIGLEHMNKGGGILEVGNTEGVKSKKVVFKKNDVLYGKLRPYLNKHAYVEFDGVASTDILVYRNKNIRANKLLNMYLGLPQVLQYANENSNGINLPRVSPKAMDNMFFPLPPFHEQKRIADKVERLISKIDEAKQLIEEAKETFELRRAAILEKAFRGELTKKWRGENLKESSDTEVVQTDKTLYNLPFNWEWIDLDTVCEKITDGTHHSPKSYPSGDYMYITAKNIKKQGILLDNVTYVSKEVHQEIYNRCDVKKGDVLYIKDGATTGIATVNQITEEFSLLSSVALLRPKRNVLAAKYLMYCLNSPSTKSRMLGMISGNAITRLTLKKIKQGIIPLPPFDEQEIIVSILEKVNSVDEQLDCVTNLEDNINNLKQSILSKAFRGELGTNDPSEESAIELLKEVLQDQVK